MPRIRCLEIENFRGVKKIRWYPDNGLNCLIGPGDSCKTTILDAIDLCLSARRNLQFTDADFHALDVNQTISITCTIGALEDRLKTMDAYGLYVRSYNRTTGEIEDEPAHGCETVLTVNLTVGSDLEPAWSLVSVRAAELGQTRNLSWGDRQRISPTRIGAGAEHNLAWRRGSILNKLSDEKADASMALVKAGREARVAFGDQAEVELSKTLTAVKSVAAELGINVGKDVRAQLDAHSVSFSSGTISLHSENGVPLRAMGTGSTRLLIAGLQRKAADEANIVLVDELEHGLEPHRIMRLLHSLGSKDTDEPIQGFLTSHSPIALRELSGEQIWVVRRGAACVEMIKVGGDSAIQGTIRCYPDAFLARSVIICEGASEIGLLRGLDQCRVADGKPSLMALGVGLIDAGGVKKIYKCANVFLKLGYRCLVLRDDDQQPVQEDEELFIENGGTVIMWSNKHNLEQELFTHLDDTAIRALLDCAETLHDATILNEHVKSTTDGKVCYNDIYTEVLASNLSAESRAILGKASSKKNGWFKSITWMEQATIAAVGPGLTSATDELRNRIDDIFDWSSK